jgi:predicted RNA methylase
MCLANSSLAGIREADIDGKVQRRGIGDKLSSAQASTLQSKTFYGNDVDPQMVRLATMNLADRMDKAPVDLIDRRLSEVRAGQAEGAGP